MDHWTPSIPLNEVENGIYSLQQALCEVDDKSLMVGIGLLVKHAEAYRIDCNAQLVAETWRDAMRDMPLSLFEKYLPQLIASWRDTFRLPPPGALWDLVRDENAELRKDLDKLETILHRKRQNREPESEDIGERMPANEVEDLVRNTVAALKSSWNGPSRL